MNNKWKYNAETNCVDEQPTMDRPLKTWYEHEFDAGDKEFNEKYTLWEKHINSLRHIPVSGTVEWKDGEDVIGKFTIKDKFFFSGEKRIREVAIPIQEQPQPVRLHSWGGSSGYHDFEMSDGSIKTLPHETVCENQSQEQQPIEDNMWKIHDLANEIFHKYPNDKESYHIAVKAGYDLALSQQAEQQPIESEDELWDEVGKIIWHYGRYIAELKKQFTIKRKS